MITGRFPRSHGVINPLVRWDAKGVLGQEQLTLAEILKAEGYACYGYVTNPNVVGRFGFDQGYDEYGRVQSMRADEVNRLAMGKISTDLRRPFFLYLHYMEPHSPYKAPEAYASKFLDSGYSGEVTGDHGQLDQIVAGEFHVDDADVTRLRALYDQEIRGFDDAFQSLLDSLRAKALDENTVIVFIADHGEEFLEHGSVLHGYTLYEEQLRVPMIIYDPRLDGPVTVDAVTRHVDLLPTLLELADLEPNGGIQGHSLVPLMHGEDSEDEAVPVFAQASLMAVKTVRKRSLMLDGWKIIESAIPHPRVELYNLEEDPHEQRDLSQANAEKTRAMMARIHEFAEKLPQAESQTVQLNRQETEVLRSLGYIR